MQGLHYFSLTFQSHNKTRRRRPPGSTTHRGRQVRFSSVAATSAHLLAQACRSSTGAPEAGPVAGQASPRAWPGSQDDPQTAACRPTWELGQPAQARHATGFNQHTGPTWQASGGQFQAAFTRCRDIGDRLVVELVVSWGTAIGRSGGAHQTTQSEYARPARRPQVTG